MSDLPRLSTAQGKALEAFIKTKGDEPAAYIAAYPNAKRWKPETVQTKAAALFQLDAMKAHLKDRAAPKAKKKPKPKRKAETPAAKKKRLEAKAAAKQSPAEKPEPNPVGRPTKMTDANMKLARAYLTNFFSEHKHNFPHVAGLAMVMDCSKETCYAWARNENNTEFSDILGRLRTNQEATVLNKSSNGEINPTIGKMILSKHGWHETQVLEHTGPGGAPIQTQSASLSIQAEMDPGEAAKIYLDMLGDST